VPPRRTLVLGGVRSGKSAFAERLARDHGGPVTYIATAQALDPEMERRIAAHRARRDPAWRSVEASLDLPDAIGREAGAVLLVDCLTLWITNLMLGGHDLEAASLELEEAVATAPGALVLVSNEVGLGGIAADPMARAFADHAGALHQRLAVAVEGVAFVAAGLPLWLKR
jgi:adenosyl cobinamide kinase/adenosyl cobinamide phosphate guanylyltransferase